MSRIPSDPEARSRLRDAQAAESEALAAVVAADRDYEQRKVRVDRQMAKLADILDRSGLRVCRARAGLVQISGLERAAVLLGLSTKELRRSVAHAAGSGAKEVAPNN